MVKAKVLKDEKNELEIEIDDLTIAEVLRIYLHKDSAVEFAAWKREHPTKPVILAIETKGKTAKKALQDAVSLIEKETLKLVEVVKKS
ncbi:MAG: RpoL/Rpb11 RNA polymerase subunit family protein [Nanoarchaeota archaeon]|nr:RpoL/Rpb11 RNA polymerase subunit family protein [Nanoarchaeota archaeon]